MSDAAIRTWPASQIDPKPAIPRASFTLDADESHRRGRRFEVYRVQSGSRMGKQHTVTYNGNNATFYCTCEAADHERLCRHIIGVRYWTKYMPAWRAFSAMDTAELEARDLEYRKMAKGLLGSYALWHIDHAALQEVLTERKTRAA